MGWLNGNFISLGSFVLSKTINELEKRNQELLNGLMILQERNVILANQAKDAKLVAWIMSAFGIASLILLCVF